MAALRCVWAGGGKKPSAVMATAIARHGGADERKGTRGPCGNRRCELARRRRWSQASARRRQLTVASPRSYSDVGVLLRYTETSPRSATRRKKESRETSRRSPRLPPAHRDRRRVER